MSMKIPTAYEFLAHVDTARIGTPAFYIYYYPYCSFLYSVKRTDNTVTTIVIIIVIGIKGVAGIVILFYVAVG